MSVTVCWAAKGGSGTTLDRRHARPHLSHRLAARRPRRPAANGARPPRAARPRRHRLAGIRRPACRPRPADASTSIARRACCRSATIAGEHDDDRWLQLVAWLASQGTVVIDAGTRVPPLALVLGDDRAHAADHTQLLRRCEPGGRRGCRPDGVVLVSEPGRSPTPAATSSTPSAHPSWRRSTSIRRSVGSSMPACSRRGCRAASSTICGVRRERRRPARRASRRRAVPGGRTSSTATPPTWCAPTCGRVAPLASADDR